MTQISHIVPVDLLHLIEGRDFYMCLANIASKDEDYAAFYRKQSDLGKFVLLDNGAAEHDQMTLDIMWDVIQKVHPTEVILNDCLLNSRRTIKSSLEALDFYKKKGYKGQFMFVPQGKNFKDWVYCYNHMSLVDIDTIGVSKFLTSGWNDSDAREKCCEFISQVKTLRPKVHLLGCHENIKEVGRLAKKYDFVRSNDTAIAYIYALCGKHIDDGDRPTGEICFYKSQFDDNRIDILKENINKFDEIVK